MLTKYPNGLLKPHEKIVANRIHGAFDFVHIKTVNLENDKTPVGLTSLYTGFPIKNNLDHPHSILITVTSLVECLSLTPAEIMTGIELSLTPTYFSFKHIYNTNSLKLFPWVPPYDQSLLTFDYTFQSTPLA